MTLPSIFERTGRDMPRTFSTALDTFFDDFLKNGELTRFVPTVDISESDKEYEMKVEVPGMKKEDFKVEVQGDNLVVSGERKWEKEDKDRTYHRIESQYGNFTRSFSLPDDANSNNIDASYKDGVLRVSIPKDEKKSTQKKIQVK